MSADSVRSLSTNACEVEEVVRHRGASGNKRGARGVSEEIAGRVRFESNKFAVMGRFKDRRQALTIRGLSPGD